MEIPKQIAEISNDTLQLGIFTLGVVAVILSFGSCVNHDNRIESDEKIRMAELRLEYNQSIDGAKNEFTKPAL